MTQLPQSWETGPASATDCAHFQLQLTHQCQLDCVYCGLDRSKPDLSEATIARGLELLFTSSAPDIEVQFFGGEPLLRFDLIRFAVDRIEMLEARHGRSVRYEVATNGLLLDERRVAYLAEHRFGVVFSLDGRPDGAGGNRPLRASRGPSPVPYPTQRVLDGFARLRAHGIDPMVNMVVGPADVSRLLDNVGYVVEELGATQVRLSYRLGTYWDDGARRAYLSAVEAALDRYRDRAHFVNLTGGDEPVLAATNVNLDSDGRLYLGCTLSTTRDFPSLAATNLVGDLNNLDTFDAIDRAPRHQLVNLVASPDLRDEDRAVIRNNLQLGFEFVAFIKGYVTRHSGDFDLEQLGLRSDLSAGAPDRGWTARSPEELAESLPPVDEDRLAAARRAGAPGAIRYPLGTSAAELALLAGLVPAALLEIAPGERAAVVTRFERRGHHVASDPDAPHRVAISRDPARARALLRSDAACHAGPAQERVAGLVREQGQLLGLPACCVAAAAARAALPTRLEQARDALARTTRALAPRLNVLDRGVFQLAHWLPCAFDCAASTRHADRVWALLARLAPPFARHLDAALAAHRLVFHDRAQLSVDGLWDGQRLLVERVWPTSRDRHPGAAPSAPELEAMARLAVLVADSREVRFDGDRVALRDPRHGAVTATLFPFGARSAPASAE